METDSRLVLSQDEAMEIFSFLIAAARTQMEDPNYYASMRLLTAAEQLRDAMVERCSSDLKKMLTETVSKTEAAQISLNDSDAHARCLDELNAFVTRNLVERAGLGRSE